MPQPHHPLHHRRPYGVGLAYRYVVHEDALEHRGEIDLLELPTEDYLVRRRRLESDPDERLLNEALAEFPCVAHGISLSIGSVEPLPEPYLEGTDRFLRRHQLEVFSEHLAFHRFDQRDLTLFLPLPFEDATVQWIRHQYWRVRERLGRPFALENVTYHFPFAPASLSEGEFLARVMEETDGSLLLDVTNLFNNSHNHGYDPARFLEEIPLGRVSQLHLAGGHLVDGKWEDSHSRPVMDPVWELYEEVVRRTSAEIVIIERDSRFHPFDTVMEDVRRAREIFYRHRPATASTQPSRSRDSHSAGPPDCLLEWDAPEFHDLRALQSALMGRITRPDYRGRFAADPVGCLDALGLGRSWRDRVLNADPASMERFEQAWDAFAAEATEDKARAEQAEWAAWARILQEPPAS